MKFLGMILQNAQRNPIRSFLTIASLTISLALATFALHLNAFEERTHGVLRSIDQSRYDGLPGQEPARGGTIASQ